jgi:hypothetical protein
MSQIYFYFNVYQGMKNRFEYKDLIKKRLYTDPLL